jgi:molybdate transport system substrate-binding protein
MKEDIMRYIAILSVLCLLLGCAIVHGADTLHMYAGAASKPPTEEAAQLYENKTGVKIDRVIGSSGHVLSQMYLGSQVLCLSSMQLSEPSIPSA